MDDADADGEDNTFYFCLGCVENSSMGCICC